MSDAGFRLKVPRGTLDIVATENRRDDGAEVRLVFSYLNEEIITVLPRKWFELDAGRVLDILGKDPAVHRLL